MRDHTRGIRRPGVSMVTRHMLGSVRNDPETLKECLVIIGSTGSGSGGF